MKWRTGRLLPQRFGREGIRVAQAVGGVEALERLHLLMERLGATLVHGVRGAGAKPRMHPPSRTVPSISVRVPQQPRAATTHRRGQAKAAERSFASEGCACCGLGLLPRHTPAHRALTVVLQGLSTCHPDQAGVGCLCTHGLPSHVGRTLPHSPRPRAACLLWNACHLGTPWWPR